MPDIELPYNYTPRAYQVAGWEHFFPVDRGKRAIFIAHRRWGKDLFGLNLCGCKMQERVGMYWHMLPTYKQGRAIVWNGADHQGRAFRDYFHPQLVQSQHTNEMRIHYHNGSIYQVVGTDDINRLVGTNPVGVVLSEFALHDPKAYEYVRPILRENGGWALFITTIRGKNHAYRLAKIAERIQKDPGSDWLYLNQTILDTHRDDGTPVVSETDVAKDRDEGMPEELIRQEYYNDAEAPLVGAYYSKEMAKALKDERITRVPHDPKLPVDTHWDIGVGDANAIIFSQCYGQEFRIIDYYENSGEGLPHYIKKVKEKDYVYGVHNAPWDVDTREWTSGKSRLETARKLGIKFRVTPQHSVEDGIEQVRSILNRCWFDAVKCDRLVEALRAYRKEEAPAKLGYTGIGVDVKLFLDNPVHDWSSHPADAFRCFAWNVRGRKKFEAPPQVQAEDDYKYV